MSEETMNTYLPSGALDELQSRLTTRGASEDVGSTTVNNVEMTDVF